MVTYELHHRVSRLTGSAILAAATCLSVYLYIRPALNSNTRKPPSDAILRVQAQASTASESEEYEELPYPPDAFPGGRDVETAYGNIKVFEWGPENGEKVLLIHGIGTPCLALGDMAWEFVRKGYRVMMFGELPYLPFCFLCSALKDMRFCLELLCCVTGFNQYMLAAYTALWLDDHIYPLERL